MEAPQLLERFEAAVQKMEAADYSAALADFELLESLSDHPSDIAYLRLLQTSCLTDMSKKSEARDRIGTIDKNQLEVAPQIGYEYEYARIMRAEGSLQVALALARNALKSIQDDKDLNKSNLAISLNTLLGILLSETGHWDEAIIVLKQVPTEDLGWAEAMLHLGDCRFTKGLYHEAISDYESVISRREGVHPIFFHAALRNTGCAFYYLGEYAKAVEYLSMVKDKYEDYPALKSELLGTLASAHSKLEEDREKEKAPPGGALLQ
jgi:tetratricopeptide (TPR) repeat protein